MSQPIERGPHDDARRPRHLQIVDWDEYCRLVVSRKRLLRTRRASDGARLLIEEGTDRVYALRPAAPSIPQGIETVGGA